MGDMNVEQINVFLMAATQVMKDMCQLQLSVGKPYVKPTEFDKESIVVSIGITGEIRGQVLLVFDTAVACDIASKMCFTQITQLDDLSISALSELGNMVLGNAATVMSTKGIGIDITPPSIIQGDFRLASAYAKNICIPLSYDEDKIIELDISLRKE